MHKWRLVVIFVLSLILFTPTSFVVSANSLTDGDINDIYTVSLFDGTFLFERTNVEVGDIYINHDMHEYVVVTVNHANKTGYAKFNKIIELPKVDFNLTNPSPIDTKDKTITLYSTHNDESYVTGDGYDSVYGKGGIHDVANKLRTSLNNQGINTIYDETLHIPHDTGAYTRSSKTAKNLIEKYSPNAIFDIHRDGASRKTYVSTFKGKEVCKVRIVIGKSNSNYETNKEFALYLMSVANEIHPWLFLDIYFGQGHYNQSLSNKALLFEMGSHLVEKSLVMQSVEPLAEVINIALFGTTISEDGNAVIGGSSYVDPTIDEYFNDEKGSSTNWAGLIITLSILFLTSAVAMIVYFKVLLPKTIKANHKNRK